MRPAPSHTTKSIVPSYCSENGRILPRVGMHCPPRPLRNLLVLGGCISQYISPLGNVRIQYMNAKIKAATIIIRKIVPMSQHELFTRPCSNRDDDDNDGDEKCWWWRRRGKCCKWWAGQPPIPRLVLISSEAFQHHPQDGDDEEDDDDGDHPDDVDGSCCWCVRLCGLCERYKKWDMYGTCDTLKRGQGGFRRV